MTRGLSGKGFDFELRRGQAREKALAKVLLEGKGEVVRIEHKRDHKARRTGRLFVEYRQPTGASGIARTEETADWWAFEFLNNVWLILPREHLIDVATRVYHTRPDLRKSGGDYDNYQGVCVPLALFLQVLTDLDTAEEAA